MKIYTCEQGESAWLDARLGKVTASEADQILTPEFAMRKGEGVQTYIAKKCAETLLRRPVADFGSFVTEEGEAMEYEARRWFAWEHSVKVRQVGFIEHEDGRCGCSPDGLIGDDGGVEIKCPQPTNHVRYVLDGTLPKDYAVQVHFSLYVTQRPWWMFVSYRKKLPEFVLKVERDEAIMAKIETALHAFYERFDTALAKLKQKP